MDNKQVARLVFDTKAWDKWNAGVERARKKMLKLVEQWKD